MNVPFRAAITLVVLSLFATACGFAEDTADAIAESFSSLGEDPESDTIDDIVENAEPADPAGQPETEQTDQTQPTTARAATPDSTPSPTPSVEPTAAPTSVPTSTPVVINGCTLPEFAQPDPNRPIYDVSLAIDVPTARVEGSASISFTPDLPIDTVVLRLWANSPRPANAGSEMRLATASIDGNPVDVEQVTATEIELDPGRRIDAGETIVVAATFELDVGSQHRGRVAAGSGYLRLGSILPTLPWEPGNGWAREPSTPLFAEAASSPAADYRVEITGTDGYDILATGEQSSPQVWNATAVRDFALSVGRFTTVEKVAMAPDPVLVTVGAHEGIADDPQLYLDKVTAVLEDFSSRWGPYPWPTLSIALTPEIRGGIEFPAHIMQDEGTLGRTTSHEIGHMYFYSLVGSNQGRTPWLDEGLATYAEFIAEEFNTNVIAIPRSALGQSGESMEYWADHRSDYYNSVYVYPGVAIASLGTTEDIDCALRRYVAANAYSVAEPADFFAAFDDVFPDVVEALAPYGLAP